MINGSVHRTVTLLNGLIVLTTYHLKADGWKDKKPLDLNDNHFLQLFTNNFKHTNDISKAEFLTSPAYLYDMICCKYYQTI
jgi:hypothetical protein